MNVKKHIPNGITCLNLLSGGLSIVYSLHIDDPLCAAWLIVLAAVFDFFDGLVARTLGVSSPIGKDLDSLADVISFGLAPAMLVLNAMWHEGIGYSASIPILCLGAGAALRLAHFNNDTRQTTSFIGLPVPSNALFWIGYASFFPQIFTRLGYSTTLVLTYALVALFCYLMLAELPMFSFKIKKPSISALSYQLTLVAVVITSLVFFGLFGFSIGIMAYVLLSVLKGCKHTTQSQRNR